jgi:hypothetical protein
MANSVNTSNPNDEKNKFFTALRWLANYFFDEELRFVRSYFENLNKEKAEALSALEKAQPSFSFPQDAPPIQNQAAAPAPELKLSLKEFFDKLINAISSQVAVSKQAAINVINQATNLTQPQRNLLMQTVQRAFTPTNYLNIVTQAAREVLHVNRSHNELTPQAGSNNPAPVEIVDQPTLSSISTESRNDLSELNRHELTEEEKEEKKEIETKLSPQPTTYTNKSTSSSKEELEECFAGMKRIKARSNILKILVEENRGLRVSKDELPIQSLDNIINILSASNRISLRELLESMSFNNAFVVVNGRQVVLDYVSHRMLFNSNNNSVFNNDDAETYTFKPGM